MAEQGEPVLSPALSAATPRPVAEVLRLYTPYYEQLLRYNLSNREFIEQRDAPQQVFRWLIELDCGCVTDAVTAGHAAAHVKMDELLPSNCVFERFLGSSESGASTDNVLLFSYGVSWKYSNWVKGFTWCAGHGHDVPVRDIVEWLERKDHPGFRSKDTGREVGPYASWTVKLSCGHYGYSAISELAWRPEQGYAKRPDFVAKIRQKLESDDLDEETRQALERMLQTDSTEPRSREGCPTCAYTRPVVGCRPVGPLAKPKPAPKTKEPPKPPSRRTLTRRLNAAEADVARLREQLAHAEQEASRLRAERDIASADPS
jgi:hypothetical protein